MPRVGLARSGTRTVLDFQIKVTAEFTVAFAEFRVDFQEPTEIIYSVDQMQGIAKRGR